jgi:hypothetical protein
MFMQSFFSLLALMERAYLLMDYYANVIGCIGEKEEEEDCRWLKN